MIAESLDSSQYDYITTYTVLKHAQKIWAAMGQATLL